ncbi:hypothetical protein Tco_0704637, partial [Tanacetum coccineum]
MQMQIMRAVKIQEESTNRELLSLTKRIDWLAGHQRSKEALQYLQQRLNTLSCLDVVLKSFGCDHSSKTTDLTSIKFLCTNTMAEQNVPAQEPTRTDEQIISVDILRNTNFFRAFSASASVPAVYIQQFSEHMKKALDNLLSTHTHPFELTSDVVTWSTSDVHKRPKSPCHLLGDDFLLEISSLISKGETYEVFGMVIPKQLITQAIQQSSYYPKYLEMVAKNTKKTPQDSASKQPEPAKKRAPPKKPTTTTPVKPTKPPSSKQPKSPSKKPSKRKLLQKVRKGKPFFQLVDEDDEAQHEPIPQGEGQAPVGGVAIKDPVSETTSKLPEVVGKAPHDSTIGPSSQPEDDTSEKVVHESSSTTVSERTKSGTEAAAPKGDKEQGEVASSTVTSGVGISVRTKDQAGSDPGKAHEALAGPDPEPMQEDQTGSDSGKVHMSLAGPNPKHMDEEFLATAYPKVHENLKLITEERFIEDNPESHSGSMSSMKNLEDTDNFGDQFLYDKPIEDDQEKSKVVDESDSTIPDPSYQIVTSTPPVIAPVIDFSSPKPSSQVTPPPINTEATSITTTLPEITPFIALQLR